MDRHTNIHDVHRNNKNHISNNQNGKHTHCILIHLNKNKNKINIKNTKIYGLISANRIEKNPRSLGKMGNLGVLGGLGLSVPFCS
jgi:hypothetical protein